MCQPMKYLLSFLLTFVFTFSFSQANLTTEKWREDLRFLQQKIHSDYKPLFKKVTKEDFDAAVDSLYQKIPTMDDHEVIVGIAEIVALFEYGHTALWLTAWRYNQLVNFQQMPYNLYSFKEGIHVQGVHDDYKESLGAKVIKVGSKSVDEALNLIRPVVSAENDQFFKAHGLHYLGVPEVLEAKGIISSTESVTLTLEKKGETFTVQFKPRASEKFPGYYGLIQESENWHDARSANKTPLWLKNLDKKYFFEFLEDHKTVYVRQSEVQDEDDKNIAQFYQEVFDFIDQNDVEKLVIDVRLNSGGNNYKNKPVVTGLIKSKLNQPGKLFVILGRRTFSACQNLVNEIENYTEATFIGEATAENVNFFGDNRTVSLPNSELPIRLSYLWWQDKDPRDNRPWTPPHVAVDISFEEYSNNVDPAMDLILSGGEIEKVKDPWLQLIDHFEKGDMEALRASAHAFVKDEKYRYFDFEDRINEAGYSLMGIDRNQEALAVLQLNAELFPNSANCWDSLAEALWKNNKIEEAKKYYNKAIKMDPSGPIGENARKMLKKIEEN